MEAHTLKVLEYDKIRAMLAERAASSLGNEAAAALAPSKDIDWITERQLETSEACGILAGVAAFPLGGIHDIRPYLDKAEREAMLQPQMRHVLVQVGVVMCCTAQRIREKVTTETSSYAKGYGNLFELIIECSKLLAIHLSCFQTR